MIDKGRIKIVEFDGEDASGRQQARESRPGGNEMRIVEFEDEPAEARAKPVMPSSGSMKIVEFDIGPNGDGTAPKARPAPKVDRAGMKIVGFDEQPADKPVEAARAKGIKIVEFD